jgi:hypothetical protein
MANKPYDASRYAATKRRAGGPSLAERIDWAITRVRAARFKLNLNKGDPVYEAALRARLDELASLRAAANAVPRPTPPQRRRY